MALSETPGLGACRDFQSVWLMANCRGCEFKYAGWLCWDRHIHLEQARKIHGDRARKVMTQSDLRLPTECCVMP